MLLGSHSIFGTARGTTPIETRPVPLAQVRIGARSPLRSGALGCSIGFRNALYGKIWDPPGSNRRTDLHLIPSRLHCVPGRQRATNSWLEHLPNLSCETHHRQQQAGNDDGVEPSRVVGHWSSTQKEAGRTGFLSCCLFFVDWDVASETVGRSVPFAATRALFKCRPRRASRQPPGHIRRGRPDHRLDPPNAPRLRERRPPQVPFGRHSAQAAPTRHRCHLQ